MSIVRAVLLLALVGLLVVWPTLALWYTDWLWFLELGYPSVFWVPTLSRAGLALFVAAVVFVILYANVRPVLRAHPRARVIQMRAEGDGFRPLGRRRRLPLVAAGVCAAVAVLAGVANTGQWVAFQQFLHAAPTGTTDPVFGLDVSFYLFRLPFWRFLQHLLWGWLLFALAAVVVGYAMDTAALAMRGVWSIAPSVRAHLSALGGMLLLVRAVGFRLDAYELLTSQRGLIFGPTYADMHARLPALNALAVLAALCAVLLFANVWLRTLRLAAGVVMLMGAAWIVGLGIVPAAVQQLVVAPNELSREMPYIQHHIDATRRAFGLDRAREQTFAVTERLGREALDRNRTTLDNIRLWDYRPLLETYRQLQGLRAYYVFADVDIDRYRIGARQQQVMLAAREMDVLRLPAPARTWVNEHLVFTHGYGAVVSPVNRVSEEGLPDLWVRDIPPRSDVAELQIARPEIYFGEATRNYAIVGARIDEFNYPRGEENVTTRYTGRAGIALSNPLRRAAFATRFANAKILLSTDLTARSRILFARTVQERTRRLAPFLAFDRDPYMVIADGRLYWIVDAYTTSDRYPYAQPLRGLNYIRNSIKAVVDAYHGTTTFYLVDPQDPLARVYARIFPGLFRPASELPDALRAHLRYPVDLFETQAFVYATYHMRDPRVFYNREDVWSWPNELFGDQTQRVEPYYVTMRLPGSRAPEFVLILPMTPQRRDNMVAWIAARNDPPHYGELLVFRFPKDRTVFGPMQVESRINQDTFISQQLTLWNQQGSRVIRGNLLVVPIEDSLLYIEPIFLQAATSQLPELKRVIAAHGPRIAMEETLEGVLARVFGPAPAPPPTMPPSSAAPDARSAELVAEAARRYERAQELLRAGDLGAYQREVDAIGRILQELQRRQRP